MGSKKYEGCPFCYFARMKKDICGIYCAGEFFKETDGTCKHFIDCHDHKAIKAFREKHVTEEAGA